MAEVKLDSAPKEVKAFYNKGLSAMERGNFDYAMDMFEEVLDIEPAFLEARKLLRAAALKKTKLQPAGKVALAKALCSMIKASAQLKKDPFMTMRTAEKLLRIDPLHPKFSKLLCDAAVVAGLPEVAILTLETLRDKKAASIDILEPLANLYQKTEQFQEEFDCRTRIVELKPNDGSAQKELKDSAARLTMGKTGWKKAESFREIVREEPEKSTDQSELEQVKERAQKSPENLDSHNALADIQLKNKLYSDAIETLEICKNLKGGPDPLIEQKLQIAREHLITQELAEAEDSNDTQRINEGRVQLRKLRMENARLRAERYPNDLQLKFEYGKLLFENGEFTEAIQQFQIARRNPQRRIRASLYLAKAFRERNQLDIALEQLQEALPELSAMDATKKELLYEMAMIHDQSGRPEDAIKLLKEIYAVDIGYRDVVSRIENQTTT